MGILATFLVLSFVVFFHELGHFLAARWAKIHVYEFAIGFGPKVYSYLKKTTQFSFRILPLGGFVKLAGMDEDDSSEEKIPDHSKYSHKTVQERMIVIVAGSAMNLILGFLIYLLLNFFVGFATVSSTIDTVFENSPAENAGLLKNDEIVAVNGYSIESVVEDLIPIIKNSKGEAITLTVKRDSIEQDFQISPELKQGKPPIIGIQFSSTYEKYSFFKSFSTAFSQTYLSIKEVFKTLGMLIQREVGFKDLAGPVGIFQIASHQFNQSVISFLNLMAYISISLGVINLFPFPVLDGGHLFFLIWEAVFKKAMPKRIETALNYVGVSLLVSLMLFVLFNDVVNWQERAQLIQRLFSGG